VHYPSDVLVGGLIGALFSFLCFKFYKFSLVKLK
jgi:membrane-associated phospholipid phosphatase